METEYISVGLKTHIIYRNVIAIPQIYSQPVYIDSTPVYIDSTYGME